MKIYIFLILLLGQISFAAQQKPESKISKFFKNMFTCGVGFEAARPDYIERSLQAQREIGIPEHKLAKTYEYECEDVIANASPFGIHIDQEKLDKKLYGFQRFTLLHEAVHKKYNDPIVEYAKGIGIGLFYGVLLIGSPGAAFTTVESKCWDIKRKCEKRADSQAAFALQCAPCLKEHMQYQSSAQDVAKGYMSNAEFQPILDSYIREKKVCKFHANKHERRACAP